MLSFRMQISRTVTVISVILQNPAHIYIYMQELPPFRTYSNRRRPLRQAAWLPYSKWFISSQLLLERKT